MSKESINEVFVYSKRVSFNDRIYDDLCEDILKWLSIEDKIKFTSVSKQFQRCLHSLWLRQKVLKIDSELNNDRYDCNIWPILLLNGWSTEKTVENGIEKLLKIFPNINEIHFERIARFRSFTNLMLRAILKHCIYLHTIGFSSFNCSTQLIEEFGQRFGPNLRSLEFVDRTQNSQKSLIACSPNLLSINGIYLTNLFENNEVLVKKVMRLKVNGVSNKDLLDKFIDNNRRLTQLNINLSFEKCSHRTEAIAYLSELAQLKVLKISFSDYNLYDHNIVKSIELIANNCKNLKSFGLEVDSRKSFDTKHCFESFQHFPTLKKFSLNSHDCSTPNPLPTQRLDSFYLKNCKQLTHLELMSDQIDDQFFVDMDSLLPILKSLIIGMIDGSITNTTMESLTKLKHLESLIIKCLDRYMLESITDSGLQKLFIGCDSLHTFGVFSRMCFTDTTVQILIRKALDNPLIYFTYYLRAFEDFINVEKVIKRSGYHMKNIVITGSKHVFDKIKDFK